MRHRITRREINSLTAAVLKRNVVTPFAEVPSRVRKPLSMIAATREPDLLNIRIYPQIGGRWKWLLPKEDLWEIPGMPCDIFTTRDGRIVAEVTYGYCVTLWSDKVVALQKSDHRFIVLSFDSMPDTSELFRKLSNLFLR